jgi:hypothetical protein
MNTQGIPVMVLRGKVPGMESVGARYRSVFVQEIMTRVHKAYWVKARHSTDDDGNKWKDLAPITHATKPQSPIERGDFTIVRDYYKTGSNVPTRGATPNIGLLTPAQKAEWTREVNKAVRELTGRKPKSNLPRETQASVRRAAENKAWEVIRRKHGRKYLSKRDRKTGTVTRRTLINVRTGLLIASTRPGKVTNNRYYPPRHQHVEFSPSEVIIRFPGIPYFAEVQAVRPIIPNNMDKWIKEAHQKAIAEAKVIYEALELKNANKSSPRSNAGRAVKGSNVGKTGRN